EVRHPYPALKGHIRSIFLRGLRPQPVEMEFRIRGILRRVVPPNLVIRPPIRRAEVDVLEAVPLDPERDSDESASPGPCIGAGFSRQFDLNCSIVQPAAL